MKINYYFDPNCPFSWITSRWLLVVQNQIDDLEISWVPFSLAIKNDEVKKKANESKYSKQYRDSLRVIRVMQVAHQKYGASLIDLYTAFGIKRHILFESFTDDVILEVLSEEGLPRDLLQATDTTDYDTTLRASIDDAISIIGQDIGVPAITFKLADDSQRGYFGPVLQSLPSKESSLSLWHGISSLAATAEFYELKRHRPDGAPDTPSTARC